MNRLPRSTCKLLWAKIKLYVKKSVFPFYKFKNIQNSVECQYISMGNLIARISVLQIPNLSLLDTQPLLSLIRVLCIFKINYRL
jgi:hypothetical protein